MTGQTLEARVAADNAAFYRRNRDEQSIQAILVGYILFCATITCVAQEYLGFVPAAAIGSVSFCFLLVGWGAYHKRKDDLILVRAGLWMFVLSIGFYAGIYFVARGQSINLEAAAISLASAASISFIVYGLIIRKWPIPE